MLCNRTGIPEEFYQLVWKAELHNMKFNRDEHKVLPFGAQQPSGQVLYGESGVNVRDSIALPVKLNSSQSQADYFSGIIRTRVLAQRRGSLFLIHFFLLSFTPSLPSYFYGFNILKSFHRLQAADHKFTNLLSQPPRCWDKRCVPPCLPDRWHFCPSFFCYRLRCSSDR